MAKGWGHKGWVAAAIVTACSITPGSAQKGMADGDWRSYAADTGSTKYSALDQIDKTNAGKLRIAWRFRTDNLGAIPEGAMQVTPLAIGGRLYAQAGSRRDVVSLDGSTGELLWMWRMDEGQRGLNAPRRGSGRGVAYWTDNQGDERIFTITPGYHLVALNAKTGVPVQSFGDKGVVDLKGQLDQQVDPLTAEIGINSPPIVGNNVVVVGAAHQNGDGPRSSENVKGHVRGFDVRTGKRLWIFHTIPHPGDEGYGTWLYESADVNGNGGTWAPITVDTELNRVYLATEEARNDYFGGARPGDNLFTNSVVCLDLNTGKKLWHFQAVHHDIWDRDFPSPPILMDLTVDGKPIKAVAVPSKQNYLYTFDRVSGKPVWPIEERPVPKGEIPGEWYSPTQPHPLKPAPYGVNGITDDDLVDFTPEIKAEARRVVNNYYWGSMWVPPVRPGDGGKLGALQVPGTTGGGNWEGGAFDPEMNIAYMWSTLSVSNRVICPPQPERSTMAFISAACGGGGRGRGAGARGAGPGPGGQRGAGPGPGGGQRGGGAGAPEDEEPGAGSARGAAPAGRAGGPPQSTGTNVFGLPLLKPPYGRLTAIDMNTGDHLWMIAVGDTPDEIKNHPMLQGLNIPRTGRGGRLGMMVTKTLLWAGERGALVSVKGEMGSWFRSYDKATGAIVSETLLPANTTGVPMTYLANGKQYIVAATGGGGRSAEFVALALP